MKQKTIKEKISLSGIGLHTGSEINLTLKPSQENEGINFIRTDVEGSPVIKATPDNIHSEIKIPRCTSVNCGDVIIHTVEHFLSALRGVGIDNITIEIDGNELPGLDGSAKEYVEALKTAGIQELDENAQCYSIVEPLGAEDDGSFIYIVPSNEFKVSYTLDYDHSFLKSQYFSRVIDGEVFEKEIAPCRTFCLEKEAQELIRGGLGKGANYTNTLVVGNDGVIDNQLRFENEFVRHKVLDCIGDLYLLGMPIKGHVFAVRSGHTLNVQLLKKIEQQKKVYESRNLVSYCDIGDKTEVDVHEIMKILPHRYPFLLVDKVVEIKKGKRGVGIKNVTINDNFFQGHFPSRPIMPGVLMVEAMAQVGGVVVLTNESHRDKVAFFMAVDKVKFRKVVVPGDVLRMEVEVTRDKEKTARLSGKATVEGVVVAEAEMMFSFADASYLST